MENETKKRQVLIHVDPHIDDMVENSATNEGRTKSFIYEKGAKRYLEDEDQDKT